MAPTLTEIVGVPSLPPGATNLQITVTLDPPYQGGPLIGLSANQYDGVRSTDGNHWVFDTNNTPFAFPMARKDIICPPPDGFMTVIITYTLGSKTWQARLKPLRPMAGDDGTLDLTTNQFPGGIIATTSLVSLVADTTAAKTAALAAAGTANAAAAGIPGQVTVGLAPVAPALAQVSQALADSAQTQALLLRIAGLTPWAGGDHTTLPNPAGDYLITRGAEQGQVWTRLTAGAAPTRNTVLEVKPSLIGTRAQRLALAAPLVITRYYETDTHLALTYTPGTGWRRDGDGGDPDYVPPPPVDGGDYTS